MSEIPICPKIEYLCKQAFQGNSSELTKLSYYKPEMLDGKFVLKPLREVLDEGLKRGVMVLLVKLLARNWI